MIYSILHNLFGWDYIIWSNSADSGVSRVRVDGLGRVWYWQYNRHPRYITKAEEVVWLLGTPYRYFWTHLK